MGMTCMLCSLCNPNMRRRRRMTLPGVHRMVIGVAPEDGTIHLSFDQHDNPFNYRVSQPGAASAPNSTNITWSADLFGPILVSRPSLTVILFARLTNESSTLR